jgi:hypothetical protein
VQHDASYPREEPGAGNLHARICEGESRMAELLDHSPATERFWVSAPRFRALAQDARTFWRNCAPMQAILPGARWHRRYAIREADRDKRVMR